VLTAALSSAIVFSLSSCVRSFTVGYMYVTGTVTATPSGNGIISGFKINNNNGKLTNLDGFPLSSGGANPVRAVLLTGGNFVYVLNRGANAAGGSTCTTADPCLNSNITEFAVGGNGILTYQATFYTQGINPFRLMLDSSGSYLMALDHDARAIRIAQRIGWRHYLRRYHGLLHQLDDGTPDPGDQCAANKQLRHPGDLLPPSPPTRSISRWPPATSKFSPALRVLRRPYIPTCTPQAPAS